MLEFVSIPKITRMNAGVARCWFTLGPRGRLLVEQRKRASDDRNRSGAIAEHGAGALHADA